MSFFPNTSPSFNLCNFLTVHIFDLFHNEAINAEFFEKSLEVS